MNGTALVLIGVADPSVTDTLRRSRLRLALVSVAEHTVVFPDHSDDLRLADFERFAHSFAVDRKCPVVAMSRCIEGVFWLGVFKNSQMVVDYDPLSLTLPWDEYASILFELTDQGMRWSMIHFYLKSRHIPFDWLRQRLILRSIGLPPWIAGESYAGFRRNPARADKRSISVSFTEDARVLNSWLPNPEDG